MPKADTAAPPLGEECACPLGEWPHPPHESGLRTLHPHACRLEYWDGEQWVVGTERTNLLYPRRYITRLQERKPARVTMLDTGTVLQAEAPEVGAVDPVLARLRARPSPCHWCAGTHPQPHDGRCLL